MRSGGGAPRWRSRWTWSMVDHPRSQGVRSREAGIRPMVDIEVKSGPPASRAKRRDDLSIGEVARRSDVAVSALHFYVLRRIAMIRVAQRAGVPLDAIRRAFDELPKQRVPTLEDWRRLSTAWRNLLQERIDALTDLRDLMDSCIGCGCLSTADCPLRNPDDRLAAQGPGPRLLRRQG